MKPLSKPFYLAGVQYADAARVPSLKPDAYLTIRHIPANAFDPFALEVWYGEFRLGHIPRTDQAAWFYHMMSNVNVQLRCHGYDRSKPPYEQIKVQFECAEMYVTTVVKIGSAVPAPV